MYVHSDRFTISTRGLELPNRSSILDPPPSAVPSYRTWERGWMYSTRRASKVLDLLNMVIYRRPGIHGVPRYYRTLVLQLIDLLQISRGTITILVHACHGTCTRVPARIVHGLSWFCNLGYPKYQVIVSSKYIINLVRQIWYWVLNPESTRSARHECLQFSVLASHSSLLSLLLPTMPANLSEAAQV